MYGLRVLVSATVLFAIAAPPTAAAPPVQPAGAGSVTNYSDATTWLALPPKARKPVDVFYVYPTAYHMPAGSDAKIAAVTDPGMRQGAAAAFARQATAFADVGNIYAPYYRQADATYALSLPPAAHAKVIEGAPLADVTAAFKYYLKHYNQGRPFLLVAHSQGSDVSTHLLATYFKTHPRVRARMIAAYIPGYSVTPQYLAANPHLRFGQGSRDTNVLLSWNTEAPTIGAPNPVLLPGAMAINPITWTRSGRVASASSSRGSWLPDATGVFTRVRHYADARVAKKRGVVVASTPDVTEWAPGGPNQFPEGVYHSFDFPFYYFDVKHNAKVRVNAFLKRRANAQATVAP